MTAVAGSAGRDIGIAFLKLFPMDAGEIALGLLFVALLALRNEPQERGGAVLGLGCFNLVLAVAGNAVRSSRNLAGGMDAALEPAGQLYQ